MATAGGTPPTGVTTKPKREVTPEQKRTYAGLGVAGVLALIVGVMYLPALLKGSGTPASVAPPSGAVTNSANSNSAMGGAVTVPTGSPGLGLAGASSSGVGGSLGAPGSLAAVQTQPVVFVSRARTDPFQPVYLIPPPAPTPIPVRPDPQVNVPLPSGFGGGVSLPSISDPRVRAAVAEPLNIGLPTIPRLETITAPRDPFPLPRTQGGGDTGGAAQQSYDKRLAGVIIGDGVRALLELPSGEQRVVQPGDEVEGIRVLNIERFQQGDHTVTRMLVRDTDGSQKFVELKPSSQAQAATGEGGAGGGAIPR